jgi:hypothetical protein
MTSSVKYLQFVELNKRHVMQYDIEIEPTQK